jgi:competence protein ComEC
MNQDDVPNREYQEFLDIISEKNIRIVGLEEILRPKTINGIRFHVLYPPKDFLERKPQDAWRTPNNNCLVLKVSFDEVSFLLTGDIEAEAEKELAALAGDALESDVLLVPHHGSKTSSTPGFLKLVDPGIAVISAGWKNIFGFPCDNVLDRYDACGCKIFRTDQDGAITITTDGSFIHVMPFLSCCVQDASGG